MISVMLSMRRRSRTAFSRRALDTMDGFVQRHRFTSDQYLSVVGSIDTFYDRWQYGNIDCRWRKALQTATAILYASAEENDRGLYVLPSRRRYFEARLPEAIAAAS